MGVMCVGGDTFFAVTIPARGETRWVGVGQQVAGYRLVHYATTDDTLVLERDGRRIGLKLDTARVKPASADRAQLVAAAQMQVENREHWTSDVTFGYPHPIAGNWWVYAHHTRKGGSELRLIVLDPSGAVISYGTPPD